MDVPLSFRTPRPDAPASACLLRWDVLDVGVDPPVVAEGVDYASVPVAVELILRLAKGGRSGLERPRVGLVSVLDVDDNG
jgi:hypothetical protein